MKVNLEFNRIAIGDHILLGGDNMDLALAYTVKIKLEAEGKALQPWQFQALTHSCREAKEKLFNNSELDAMPLVIANRGSSLIGGTLRTELTREEITNVLVEGFLPKVSSSDKADLSGTHRFTYCRLTLCAGCRSYSASGRFSR